MIKIKNIPRTNSSVSLLSMVQTHFSANTEIVNMRCSNCYHLQEHKKNGVTCPRTGICRDRGTVEMCQLTKAPKFLFIQLVQNVGIQPKVSTFVEFKNELVLPGGHEYEPIATVYHIGKTPSSGHYVTNLKLKSGHWMTFDDEVSRICSLKEANTNNNYILLFKRKEMITRENIVKVFQEREKARQSTLSTVTKPIQQEIENNISSIKEDTSVKKREIEN
jgi:ubiquitin C-terminal hydrolase